MSIIAAAEVLSMSLHRGERMPSSRDVEPAMELMEAGVPLRLLVDIALPLGLIRELYTDTERAAEA